MDIDETKWGATSVSKIRYNYDWLGRRINEINTGIRAGVFGGTGWVSSTGFIHEWEYDSRSQVTNSKVHAADSGGNPNTGLPTHALWRKWEFDPMGNKKQEWVANGSAETWNSNALNQATLTGANAGMGSPTYDASGNLKQDTNWDYEYDAENRLKSITSRIFGNDDRFEYLYDYLGRRVRKQKMHKTTYVVSEHTRYLYVGWQLVAELNGLSLTGSPLRSYAWGIDAAGTLGGTGALLMVKEGAARQFAITDSRQSIRAYMDESGALTKATEYTANGEIALEWNSGSAPTTTLGYASLYRDKESGMNYHHHRYYHPKLGKFISRDPIGVAGGLNLYGYVGNNHVNNWDFLGLFDDLEIEICPPDWEEWDGETLLVHESSCYTILIPGSFGNGGLDLNIPTVGFGTPGGGRGSSPPSKSNSNPQDDKKGGCDELMQRYGAYIRATTQTRFGSAREASIALGVQISLEAGPKGVEYSGGVFIGGDFDDGSPGKGNYYGFTPPWTDGKKNSVVAWNEPAFSKYWNTSTGSYAGRIVVHAHSHPWDGVDYFSYEDQQFYHAPSMGEPSGKGVNAILITPNLGIITYSPGKYLDNYINRRPVQGKALEGAPSPRELQQIIDCFGKK